YLGSPNLNNTAHKTIKELIVENEDFILLKEALILTDLLNLLDEEGPYTVFAPANETFIGLLGYFNKDFSNLENLTGEAEIALLREVLLYHVLGSRLQSNEFVLGSIPTLSGSNTLAMVNQDDEGDQFSLVDALHLEANFDVKDIQAKNGIIHTIDRILIPESAIEKLENQIAIAVEMAMIDTGDLKIALDLFKMVQNDLDLQELAKNEFTFFLPSDQAFLNLFNDLGIDAVAGFNNEAGSQLLAKILGYHLIENKRLKLSQLATGQKFTTAQGEDLEVAISSDIALIDKSGMPSRIILTNQEVFKGIIHVVDKVLLPTEVLDSL
ncbi:MAG: fasciclin domain-containing protein, partial [Maribacter sp.]